MCSGGLHVVSHPARERIKYFKLRPDSALYNVNEKEHDIDVERKIFRAVPGQW